MVIEGVFAPAHVLVEAIRRREVSSLEVVEAYLAQIARHNPDLQAVVTLDEDGARIRARKRMRRSRAGRSGPLSTACRSPWRMPTLPRGCVRPGAGCHVWRARPGSGRQVAARLKAAGAILLGKTSGPEIWPDSVFARTNNPGTSLIRRGSSAGAGAAIALA